MVRTSDRSSVPRNAVCEMEFTASRDDADPWSEVDLDIEFTAPDGTVRVVPAFWAGGRTWRIRYSSAVEGVHGFRSIVRASGSTGLEGEAGEVTVVAYDGDNPLLHHGAPVIAPGSTHLAHADGQPFFWLADVWWSAMTARFRWPDTFQAIADDRAAKGFTVVQLVAGLVPEFVPFSPPMASEGGQPWLDDGKGQINPAYYDVPDAKIDYLVDKGIVPCIVGGWSHYAELIGRERVMQHWRYLVARYGAYPVVWCIAGEVNMVGIWEALAEGRVPDLAPLAELGGNEATPSPAARDFQAAVAEQVAIWEAASELVGDTDPFGRIRTVHPIGSSSRAFTSRDSFDLDMLQTGHSGWHSVPATMVGLRATLAHGDKPALVGEVSFEGIFDSCWQDVQRFVFWSNMLSGAAGHTYGTMAISTFNSEDDPYVPLSRVGMHYWQEAITWLGAAHVAVGKGILERFDWSHLTPCPAAVEPHSGPDDWYLNYAAKTPDGTILVYQPSAAMTSDGGWSKFGRLTLDGLSPDTPYRVRFIDPRLGTETLGPTFAATDGRHVLEAEHFWITPTGEDWVIAIQPDRT